MVVRSVSFAPPHTPPTTREDDLSVLRLIRSRRVGPATFHRLIADHGSAADALAALPDIAAAAGIEGYAPCPEGVAAAELAAGRRLGAELITLADPRYPLLLREIPDAPPALWVQGEVGVLARPLIAVVGARNASSLGLRIARGLALSLSEAGIGVTAGLARGVDTAAHEASCAAGTIAVLAGGIDRIYPAENRALAERIRAAGCLISEQPPGLEPVARHFPTRNRIVSGLCAGVVVVEAAHRSGTLITARCAAEQGREVMAVPGHPLDARAGGCNALIRDGATLVRSAADVLAAVGIAAVSYIHLTLPTIC
ncbi:DNA-processing protein DprA, partial [Paracoccus sanguinis]|uniref:DNA-processing protein DprA n=1 Tax=Paracoccus sanguinis TaxID=1545044 RepID=UPI0009DCE9FE